LTVNSGLPTITNVEAVSDSPNEGTTKVVHFYFNATHPNGVDNIPFGNAVIQINKSAVFLTTSGCTVASTSGITNRYDCSVTLNYYNLPGAWTINATITDLAANKATDSTVMYTNGNIYGLVLSANSITFSGNPGETKESNMPQKINNTGNMDFANINITAYNLQSGSNFIEAGNFTANTTNASGAGHNLLNATSVKLADSALVVSGSQDVYMYLTIPNGVANGTYTTVSPWTVTLS
jgi:hypothetical protein